jgi:hypothetical protein
MIRHLFVGFAALVCSSALNAQSTASESSTSSCEMTTMGFSYQANRTNIYGPTQVYRYTNGYSASVDLGWKLAKRVDFKSGLVYTKSGKLFVQEGSVTNAPADKFELKTNYSYHTLTIPLCLEIHPETFKKISPYGGIGGLIGGQLGANATQTGFVGNLTIDEEINNIYENSPIKSTGIAIGAIGYAGIAYQACTNYQLRLHTQASTIVTHDRWDDRVTANRFWNLGIGLSIVRMM